MIDPRWSKAYHRLLGNRLTIERLVYYTDGDQWKAISFRRERKISAALANQLLDWAVNQYGDTEIRGKYPHYLEYKINHGKGLDLFT